MLLLDPLFDSNFLTNELSIQLPALAGNSGDLGVGITAAGSFTQDHF